MICTDTGPKALKIPPACTSIRPCMGPGTVPCRTRVSPVTL